MQILLKLLEGLASHSEQIGQSAMSIVTQLATSLLSNLPDIVTSGVQLVVGLVTGIIKGLPQLIAAIPQIIVAIVQALIENLPAIYQAGAQLLSMLGSGIMAAVPQIWTAITEIVLRIAQLFQNTDWGAVGLAIIRGIGSGLQAGWQWLIDTVSNIALSLWNTAKSVLGIQSPSKKFRFIGAEMNEGTEKGLEDTSEDLTRTVTTMYASMGDAAANELQPIDMDYTGASLDRIERDMSFRLTASGSAPDMTIIVPLYLDEREIARATAWSMGEQLAWLEE